MAPAGPAVAVRESWVRRTAKRLLVLAATEKGPEVLFWLGCKLLVGSGVIGIVSFLLTRLGIASWFGLN